MDSLTHVVLGAAIGEVILGRSIGRKAAVIGAFAKTIPDFDLFYTGLNDPFAYLCHHRGHTHSLFWELLYAFPFAYIFYLLFNLFKKQIPYIKWVLLFIVCLWGHSLIDSFTNYGTRLLLPFTNRAFSTYSLSIVDLFLTLPMIIFSLIGAFYKTHEKRKIWAMSILIYCCIYLTYTFANKMYANQLFSSSLSDNHISYQKTMTNPTILNNFLWYGIATNDSSLYIAENSLLYPSKNLKWLCFKRNKNLLDTYQDTQRVEVLKWFSDGFDISELNRDTLNVFCVKFGRTNMTSDSLHSSFVFHYKLFQTDGVNQMSMLEPGGENTNYKEGFIDLYHRIIGK
jgi:inner membrane protein